MAEDMMTEIENEIRNNKVVMYMKGTRASPQCGFSAATTEILQDLGKPFHTVDVLSSPEKRDAIKRFSNWPTIPQVYVNGTFIAGRGNFRRLIHRGAQRGGFSKPDALSSRATGVEGGRTGYQRGSEGARGVSGTPTVPGLCPSRQRQSATSVIGTATSWFVIGGHPEAYVDPDDGGVGDVVCAHRSGVASPMFWAFALLR